MTVLIQTTEFIVYNYFNHLAKVYIDFNNTHLLYLLLVIPWKSLNLKHNHK